MEGMPSTARLLPASRSPSRSRGGESRRWRYMVYEWRTVAPTPSTIVRQPTCRDARHVRGRQRQAHWREHDRTEGVGVPGAVAGMIEAHRRYVALPSRECSHGDTFASKGSSSTRRFSLRFRREYRISALPKNRFSPRLTAADRISTRAA